MEYFHTFMERIVDQKAKDQQMPQEQEEGIDVSGVMARVNRQKRWVYRGSFTTPPCIEGVFWNVIDDVFWVKQKTIDLFKQSMQDHKRGDHRCGSCGGNQRIIQPVGDRKVFYVVEPEGRSVVNEKCREDDYKHNI